MSGQTTEQGASGHGASGQGAEAVDPLAAVLTGYREGGARRIDQVLSPPFVEGLADLSDAELRTRRDMAIAEEADLAYTRRLVDGRLALLLSERARRERSERSADLGQRSDDEIVAGLVAALLSSDAGGQDDAAREVVDARDMPVVPSNAGIYHRDAERAFADIRFSDLGSLEDAELEEHAALLSTLEQRLTGDRGRVLQVLRLLRRAADARAHTG